MKRIIVLGVAMLALPQAVLAAVVTRGPYLQIPTSSSIIVRWRTDDPTTSQVAYGPMPGSLSSTVDDGTSTTEHIVTVSGLSADTQYYYSVGEIGVPLAGDTAAA